MVPSSATPSRDLVAPSTQPNPLPSSRSTLGYEYLFISISITTHANHQSLRRHLLEILMPSLSRLLAPSIACLTLMTPLALLAQQSSVKLIHSVDLHGYSGDFDHFAVDYDRNRLLLAAEDHGTLEVFDLKTSDHLRTVAGFGNPHSILVRPGVSTVFITDSTQLGPTIRSASNYAKLKSVRMSCD